MPREGVCENDVRGKEFSRWWMQRGETIRNGSGRRVRQRKRGESLCDSFSNRKKGLFNFHNVYARCISLICMLINL